MKSSLYRITRHGIFGSALGTRRRARTLACAAAFTAMIGAGAAFAVGIQGTMSNFDVFNETGINVYGAEIDLEGLHPNEITKTYPSHFTSMTATEYSTGTTFGTKLIFTGYTFNPPYTYIIPMVGHSTNGHYAVNLPGCEHFGFSVARQPTATSFYWLSETSQRVGVALSIPMPTWTYVPAAGGAPAVMQAVLAPPPPPPIMMYPDAVWVKTYVTELPAVAELEKLISFDPDNPDPDHPSVAPQSPAEVEAEWELLPGDAPLAEPDIQLAEADQSVVRRYEFYQYTGTYDEVHLPNYQYDGGPLPPDAPVGQFIAANMVAANLGCELASITLQPFATTTCGSGAVSFDVAATGAGPFTYQWRLDSALLADGPNGGGGAGSATILGANTAKLTITAPAGGNLSPTDAGVYDCIVTNACGDVTSDGAPLTICFGDYNCDGGVDGTDVQAFFTDWEMGVTLADINSDGGVDGGDVGFFFERWEMGC